MHRDLARRTYDNTGALDARRGSSSDAALRLEETATLLACVRRGDEAGLALFFKRFADPVNGMVWRLLGDDQDHDDVVADVFVRLLRGVSKVRDAERLDGWVMKVTINTVRNELRRRSLLRRFRAVDYDPDHLSGRVADPEKRCALARALTVLQQLGADGRVVFTLRHLDGRQLPEIAGLCGCSLATVKRRLNRAEKRFTMLARREPELRELLEPEG